MCKEKARSRSTKPWSQVPSMEQEWQIGKGRGTAAEAPAARQARVGGAFGALVRAGAPPLTVCAGRIGASPMQLVAVGTGIVTKDGEGMQLRLARSTEASTRKRLGYLKGKRPHEPWPAGDVPLAKQLKSLIYIGMCNLKVLMRAELRDWNRYMAACVEHFFLSLLFFF